jgi:hypothetical protein
MSYKTHRHFSDYAPYSFLLIILKPKPKLRGRPFCKSDIVATASHFRRNATLFFKQTQTLSGLYGFRAHFTKSCKIVVRALTAQSGKLLQHSKQ